MAKTQENKGKTKNGVKRLIFSGLAVIAQLTVFLYSFIYFNEYLAAIGIICKAVGIIIVIALYSQHKTSTMKMPWIMLILIAPICGVVLYVLIGLSGITRKIWKRFVEIDKVLFPYIDGHEKEQDMLSKKYPLAAGISKYIKDYSGYPLYSNTDVTYYADASQGLEAQLKDLQKARHFIFMEYFAIEDESSWIRIQRVLEDRVNNGVLVRVFYDDLGSIGFVNLDFAKKLQALGIGCKAFNPVKPGVNFFVNYRDHRKLTVIDGKVGYTGGYNLANEYFNITKPYGNWKDAGIRLEGDAVKSLTLTFLEMWNAVSSKDMDDFDFSDFFKSHPYQAREQSFVQPYADTPLDNEQVGENVYINILSKADKYCYFATPYLILTDEMTHALCLAAKRGVDVRIVTPGIPDKKAVFSLTRSFYSALAKAGVRIYEWTPGFCHAKLCVSDDYIGTCGTINLDYRSLYHHFENGCLLVGGQAVADIKKDFEKLFAESNEVSEYYRSKLGSMLRFEQLILRLFAELL